MKMNISEGKLWVNFTLIPEDVVDTNLLLRLSLNASSEKPFVNYYIPQSDEKDCEANCSISIKKRKPNAQKLTIDNERQADVKGRITKSKKRGG